MAVGAAGPEDVTATRLATHAIMRRETEKNKVHRRMRRLLIYEGANTSSYPRTHLPSVFLSV
jgi:hypothetical protein